MKYAAVYRKLGHDGSEKKVAMLHSKLEKTKHEATNKKLRIGN